VLLGGAALRGVQCRGLPTDRVATEKYVTGREAAGFLPAPPRCQGNSVALLHTCRPDDRGASAWSARHANTLSFAWGAHESTRHVVEHSERLREGLRRARLALTFIRGLQRRQIPGQG
jgi:hypothetical protein